MTGRIVILTGAGISAESGVPTFRDMDGLWAKYDWRRLATPEAFAADPDAVHDFYNARRRQLQTVAPNSAHRALARLQRDYPGDVAIVTQNVDDLHERAGSADVIHMHGELTRARCAACGAVADWPGDLARADACPACARTGAMRPHIVWFGEIPHHMDRIAALLADCDVFAAIGTSGAVWPAAGFAQEAAAAGARTIEFNLAESEISAAFDETRRGPAGRTVPAWAEQLLAR